MSIDIRPNIMDLPGREQAMEAKRKSNLVSEVRVMGQDFRGRGDHSISENGGIGLSDRARMEFEGKAFIEDCRSMGVGMDFCRMAQRMAALEKQNEALVREYTAVLESEREHHNFFQSTREAIVVFDHEMRLLKANPASVRLFGYSRMTDMRDLCLDNLFAEPAILDDLLKELLFAGSIGDFEAVLCRKDLGEQRTVVMGSGFVHSNGNGSPRHFEFVFTDISKRKELEAQLLQVQKFEAIGTLASGIAHDFNNLLMGIQGRASLIAMDLFPSHPHLEHTDAIETHVQSAKMLTDQLLGFARGGKYRARPMDVNQLARETASLFGRTKKGLRIHMKCAKGIVVVNADPNQMEQVLLNMLINAWQAMPDGGDISLETGILIPDKQFLDRHGVEPGPYVRIRISDTGVGMDRAIRKRIFDPFFTTKERGRGTGLGLASAYGIIRNHGGVITVKSKPGHGSAFSVYLPLSENKAVLVVSRQPKLNQGSESILLVDDEELILDVGRAMLEKLGYCVTAAKGGGEAVKAVKNMKNKIDLVILDMIMPGMDGGKTFDSIREIVPTMRVMFASGHAAGNQVNKAMGKGCGGFIQKPFTIAELSESVRNMLDVPIPKETNVGSKG